MTIADVETEILAPMQRIFLPTRNMSDAELTAALREYGNSLQAFDRADLAAAWQAVKDGHVTRSWPLPAAFVKAARDARNERTQTKLPKRGERVDHTARWEVWKAVSRSPMAQEAARRGVAWALRCAVLQDGKRPEEIDLREFVLGKASAERTMALIEAGQAVPFKGRILPAMSEASAMAALRMYRGIQAKEAEAAQEINYGVVEAAA